MNQPSASNSDGEQKKTGSTKPDWTEWPFYIQCRASLENANYRDPKSVTANQNGLNSIKTNDVINWIYGVLTTLDGKASALMRLNGVLIAAAAFLLGLFGRGGGTILSTTNVDAALIIFSTFLSAISICLCLLVVNVSWPFLGRVEYNKGTQTFDFTKEIRSLVEASQFRQGSYRFAWYISLIAAIIFLVEITKQAAYVLCNLIMGES